MPLRLLRWLLALMLPAIPIAAYYVITVIYNPAMAIWNRQNVTTAPSLPILLLGFGIPLLVALPGIYRAVRRFERDGDRLMLLWLVSMVVAIYLPVNVQRRFAVGMMIPVAYFATRAIEDVWLPRISRRWRPTLFSVFFPLIAISQILMLFLPVLPAITGYPQAAVGIFLERDYAAAYSWLETRTMQTDVILASPLASAWIPGWVGRARRLRASLRNARRRREEAAGARLVRRHDARLQRAARRIQRALHPLRAGRSKARSDRLSGEPAPGRTDRQRRGVCALSSSIAGAGRGFSAAQRISPRRAALHARRAVSRTP